MSSYYNRKKQTTKTSNKPSPKKKISPKMKPDIFILTDEYREKIRNLSYIGQKGYTIIKQYLDDNDLLQLRKELIVEPVTHGAAMYGGKKEDNSFPVFRENIEKIYIPRFYGIRRYGIPNRNELCCGDSIDVPFIKPIRDYQENIIQVYLDHVRREKMGQGLDKGLDQGLDKSLDKGLDKSLDKGLDKSLGGGGILEVPCGRGKTVMALKIISILSKKTLILVHKEFLMNQWIERIKEFIPNARVGIIQGQKFEVDNKDIVIGMIQTLYDRPFPANAFTSFGLTIIDEVHRIGSEEFSKTLLKTITPYMLGISATVERKDGLTDILYMFIGEKIYSEARKDEDDVQVRAIQYMNPDVEYNTVEYDYRENVKYSTMITKIGTFVPRSDFIVRILRDLMVEDASKQIMVLSHTRALLSYLSEEINRLVPEIQTGFYIGGMKQDKLQETESKQIVFATYSMAAEALDIKSLNTLVMVTPKTDIIQSVGRILRTKGPGKIIVDLTDTHTVFQNQWKKRKTFYRKCDYPIRFIDSDHYAGMNLDWDIDTTWKQVFISSKQKTGKSACISKNETEDSGDSDSETKLQQKHTCLISLSNI
jgi:superfamily II DNA or RNA helicase